VSGFLDRLGEGRFSALVSAPGLILVGLVIVPPIAASIAFSLFRIELGGPGTEPFVALRNWVVRLPADTAFFGTLAYSLAFGAIVTAIALPVSLGAALLVHRARRFAGLLALLLILPWAVAPIGDGLLWRLLVDPYEGLLGKLLRYAGLPQLRLTTAEGELVTMLLATTWRAVPLLGILLLGALRAFPATLGRAATMDGATPWQGFRYVTLPAIAPTLFIAGVIEFILAVEGFDIQFALTGDQTPPGTELVGLHMFRSIMESISLGYGATQTLVLGLVVGAGIWLIYLVVARRSGAEPAAPEEDLAAPSHAVFRPTPAPISAGRPAGPDWSLERAPDRPRSAWRTSASRWAFRVAGTVGAVAFAIWVLAPIAWVLYGSLEADVYALGDPPQLHLPLELTVFRVFLGSSMWQGAAVVSVVVATVATGVSLVIAALAAYPLARYRVRGGAIILGALLATQLLPPISLVLPVLYVFVRLDIRNTVPGLILVNIAFWTPVFVWLLHAAFRSVPANLDRAARMDGSSRLGVVFRIVVPAAAPAIAAATAIVFIGIWNDFVFVAAIGGRDTRTLASFLNESSNPAFHTLATKLVMSIAPCVVLVVALRRWIVRLV
jgi:ABC-type sugar transport system permease subunit